MKSYLILILVSLLALTGCKPKQTTLSGQVFIVTQGAENVKLGDVEILLIEKSQATDFLQKKQSAIDLELASKQGDLKKIEQGDVPNVLLTDSAYAKALSDFDELQKQSDVQLARMRQATKDYNNNPDHADAVSSEASAEADSIQMKMQLVLDQMKAAQSAVIKNLENYPAAADYFEGFLPVVVQKTISDADGKFSFVYPRNKSLAVFASAQRMVLNKTEKYYWLVNAPTNAESVQIFLSNNNLVEIDPDGYFALKPKAASQESSTQ